MAGKVSAEEYAKAKQAASQYTQESRDAFLKAWWWKENVGLLKKVETPTSSNDGSSNTNTWDIYWDVSGVRGSNVQAKDYSNYKTQELGDLSKFWASAREMESAKSGSISKRNDIIAGNLYANKTTGDEDIRKYLESQAGFTDAEKWEQDNTVDAIKARLAEIQKEQEGEGTNLEWGDITPPSEWVEGKAWYYNTKDGEQKIYGYDEFDEETKNLVDRLSDSQKKYISNLWAQGMQEDLKYYLDTMRAKDQSKEKFDINKEIYDINRESSIIQAEQNIRNAEESYNNLKQNWQYLGNLWMPGVSSTKIQAIWDAITEAKTTLGEVKRLTQLSLDAQEKQWEAQVLQYNQQIDNLMYDLKWKVGDEITGALSKYTTAELEWKLDTIDGITAFRKELLDELDNNLSGLTSASLSQMQWINQQYQDIANKMYEYAQNANTVNTQMSAVKGFYVDGNGNAILNAQGQPIQVPQEAPMDPIFDKETGKLITFGLDENGNIVASVQQVYQGDATSMQSTIVSLLENGVSVQDILKYVPNADLKTVQALAEIVKPTVWGYASYKWQGKNYEPVDRQKFTNIYNSWCKQFFDENNEVKKGVDWGQCWHFVNDYLEAMGMERLFTDPITEKKKYVNSDMPALWTIAIMDSESKPEYGHVWIVIGIDGDKIKILQSNKKGEEQVFVSTKNAGDIYGYFDPTKSIDEFNKEIGQEFYQAQGLNKQGYKDTSVGYYDKYLAGKFTSEDWKQLGGTNRTQFEEEVENYKKAKESEVTDVTKNMLKALYELQNMNWWDYNMASVGMPRTEGFEKRRNLENYLSNVTLNKLIESKKSWATFGALSDAELGILQNAASVLDWWLKMDDFSKEVNNMIDQMEQALRDNGRSDVIVDVKKGRNSDWSARKEVGWGNLW